MTWQPIETAPKDRRVLLWLPANALVDMRICRRPGCIGFESCKPERWIR